MSDSSIFPTGLDHTIKPSKDPYRAVVAALLLAALIGAAAAFFCSSRLSNAVLFSAGLTLWMQASVLIGVAAAQHLRSQGTSTLELQLPLDTEPLSIPTHTSAAEENRSRLAIVAAVTRQKLRTVGLLNSIKLGGAFTGFCGFAVLLSKPAAMAVQLTPRTMELAAMLCLAVAGVAAIWVRYLGNVPYEHFPEAPRLRQWGAVVVWVLVLTAVSLALSWVGQIGIVRTIFVALIIANGLLCVSFYIAKPQGPTSVLSFPLDSSVLTVLGSRVNILASVVDWGQAQMGIDLRSTWALAVIRKSVEPLLLTLLLAGWLSSSLTVIGIDERGLVERLGVPVGGLPLSPGIHAHFPWPIDKIYRTPVLRIQAVQVGHEGEEGSGPENVFWAVEHAPNEYTLLLGNGRDLITVDAAVQFRIADLRAWRYNCQNPSDALRAIAYRTVMRNTVNRTLSEALSENVVALTKRMRITVQTEADALGLGVEILGFTVGGMHPPVAVAKDYQAVVSSELRKGTAVVEAQAHRNLTLPGAEAAVVTEINTAKAESVENRATAAGEAWSFRTLESQYRAAPGEFFYRRRLEALESVLNSRRLTIVDSKFQRDGGELWIVP